MRFQDNLNEPDLGTRQCKWLDYLQYHTIDPIIACKIKGEQFSKWEPYTNFILPITLRRPLKNEVILDFDSRHKKRNYKKAGEILDLLDKTTWQHYLTDHSGRGPHIHVFNITYARAKALFKIHNTNVGEIICGKKVSREIGGLYKDGIRYCSHFKTIEDITEVINPQEVRFPTLELTVDKLVLNPIWDEVKKHKAEKEYDYVSETPVLLNNLPEKYKSMEWGVSEGGRNNAFCKLAGVFEKCGLGRWEALHELKIFNSRCKPPMTNKEVEYKFNKLWK